MKGAEVSEFRLGAINDGSGNICCLLSSVCAAKIVRCKYYSLNNGILKYIEKVSNFKLSAKLPKNGSVESLESYSNVNNLIRSKESKISDQI